MSEAFRFLNEYGDLSRLPLFNQPTYAATPAACRLRHAWSSRRLPVSADVDWAIVSALRAQASEQLSQAVAADRSRLDKAAQQELGRSIVLDLIESAMADAGRCRPRRVESGPPAGDARRPSSTPSSGSDDSSRSSTTTGIENIIIVGHDNVLLELIDGSLVDGPPVADSDQELIDFLVFLASRSEVNARSFSEAQPRLHLRLDGGSRLAAAAWVTPRPSVVIRRHRLMQVTLDDLVATADDDADGCLVPARRRAGTEFDRRRRCQGAGKTTLVRALCAEIDPLEAIGTFETEYELHLHELGRHKIVHAWEARPGSGERGPDGRQAGEFTLDEALVDSFRFNLSRQIVGEVRGKEIWAMIKAMESGTGSISTTHASDAVAAVRKLVTCAMEAGPHVTQGLATSKLAATVDLIVQLEHGDQPRPRRRAAHPPGRRDHRPRTRREGDRLRDHPRVPRRCFRSRASRTCCPTSTERSRFTASTSRLPLDAAVRSPAMSPLIPSLAGGLIVAGILGIVVGLRPTAVPPREKAPARTPPLRHARSHPDAAPRRSRARPRRLGDHGMGPRAGHRAGGCHRLPALLSAPPAATQIARLEAMEEWTRSLSGVLTVGIGLEQALVATLRSTPAPINAEVTRLVARLRARWDTETRCERSPTSSTTPPAT